MFIKHNRIQGYQDILNSYSLFGRVKSIVLVIINENNSSYSNQ